MSTVVDAAERDLEALVAGGVTAVMVENFNDIPFYPDAVPPVTVASLAVVCDRLRTVAPGVALGINVLRNDGIAAIGIAAAVGAAFVRVNVHTGAMVTDQGPLEGSAHLTLRRRRELGLDDVAILADIRVKHAAPLAARDLAAEGRDLRLRGLADAIIVSGPATGAAADPGDLEVLRAALPDCPLLLGSGVTAENLSEIAGLADGVIVGTSLKTDGWVDTTKVRGLLAALDRGKERP